MKTAISIPDPIFQQAEEAARKLRMSRSELYTTALREFLSQRQCEQITELLNQVYDIESSTVEQPLASLQLTSIPAEEW